VLQAPPGGQTAYWRALGGYQSHGRTVASLGSPARDRMVRVKFIYGDFETEMSGSAQGGTLGSGGA
jgi:hypothetical protein